MDQEEKSNMNGKIHYLVLGLLVIYGIALAAISYAVFNKNSSKVNTPSTVSNSVRQALESNAVKEVALSVDPTGKVTLDANGQTVGGFQGKLVLPYDAKLATLKAVVADKNAKVLLNKTEVDKATNQITISLVLIWENGLTPDQGVTIATLNVPATGLSFDQRFTKVIPFGLESGNLSIKFPI